MQTNQQKRSSSYYEVTMDTMNHHVLVGHLAHWVKEDHVLQVFKEFNPRCVRVIRGKVGKVAFVSFDRPKQVAKVMEKGATLRVQLLEKQLIVQPLYRRRSVNALCPHTKLSYFPPTPLDLHPSTVRAMKKDKPVPLPEECVSVIASHLDRYRDRAKLELVSRVWRSGSMDSHRKTTVLDLNDTLWGECWDKPVEITNEMLEWLFKRCGNKLLTIQLESKAHTKFLTPEVIPMIAQYCPNVKNLHVEGIDLRTDDVLQLATNAKSLRKLSVGQWDVSCTTEQDTTLSALFCNNMLLESLKIEENNLLGNSFLDITPMLRHLEIFRCNNIDTAFLAQAIRQFRQLESLNIHCTHKTINEEILWALVENTALHSTMTSLEFFNSRVYADLENQGIHNFFELYYWPVELGISIIHRYKSITVLQLIYCDWVTAETILEIGTQMTQLEYLNITGCTYIGGEFALDPLGNLTNLKRLGMCELYYDVGAGFLKFLTSLIYLDCRYNIGITDNDICDLLWHVPTLEHVNLQGCSNITRRVVDSVHELRKTSRKKVLNIFLGETKAIPHEEDRMNFRLVIHYDIQNVEFEE